MQDELFHMDPVERPGEPGRGSGRKAWGGRASVNARRQCRAMLPHPCKTCGGMITSETPEEQWHAGHLEDRGQGGADSGSNYAPEHAWCNTSQGGKLGAAITNGAKVTVDYTRERTKKWWK